MKPSAPSVLAATATVLAVAGCGGGRLDHATFVAKADTLCSSHRAQLDGITRPAGIDLYGEYIDRIRPVFREELDRMEALKAPKRDAAAHDRLVTHWKAIAATLARMHAGAGDPGRVAIGLKQVFRAQAAALGPASELGLGDDCQRSDPFVRPAP